MFNPFQSSCVVFLHAVQIINKRVPIQHSCGLKVQTHTTHVCSLQNNSCLNSHLLILFVLAPPLSCILIQLWENFASCALPHSFSVRDRMREKEIIKRERRKSFRNTQNQSEHYGKVLVLFSACPIDMLKC